MATLDATQTERVDYRRLSWVGPLTALVAAVANVVVRLIEGAVGWIPAEIEVFSRATGAVSTFSRVLLGVIVFAVIGRFARRPISTFRIVAVVALGLSFLNPILVATGALGIRPVGLETIIALVILHIVAGVTAIYLLTTQARAQ